MGGIIEQPDLLENVTTLHIIANCFLGHAGLPSAMKTFRCKMERKKMHLEHLTIKVEEIALDFSVTFKPSTPGNNYQLCVCLNVSRCCHASLAVW